MSKTTWRKIITEFFEDSKDDSWDNVESIAIDNETDLDELFNQSFGGGSGPDFTIWTKDYVYFPSGYDGATWLERVARNPNGEPTAKIGEDPTW